MPPLQAMRCLSVRPSVTFVHSVETNRDIFKKFSPSGSHTILVFPYQTSWRYSDGDLRNGGVDCRWGRQKSRFSANTWLHGVLWTRTTIHLAVTDQRVDDISRWWATEFVFDGRRRRSLNVTPKTRARSGKWSAAEMTTIKDCARGITPLKQTDTKHRAASLQQQSYLSVCRCCIIV